jgi:hypothetical protein
MFVTGFLSEEYGKIAGESQAGYLPVYRKGEFK